MSGVLTFDASKWITFWPSESVTQRRRRIALLQCALSFVICITMFLPISHLIDGTWVWSEFLVVLTMALVLPWQIWMSLCLIGLPLIEVLGADESCLRFNRPLSSYRIESKDVPSVAIYDNRSVLRLKGDRIHVVHDEDLRDPEAFKTWLRETFGDRVEERK